MTQEAIQLPLQCLSVEDEPRIAIYAAELHTGKLLFLNKYAQDRWGPEYKNKLCREYLRTSDSESCPFCNIGNLVDAEGRPKSAYRWEVCDSETGTWFDCFDEVVAWPDGRLVHVEIAVDITERKRAEEDLKASEYFSRSIIQSSCDCIKILDLDGRLDYMNDAGQKMLEIEDMSSYIGCAYNDFWNGSDKEGSKRAIDAALGGHEGRFTGYAPTVAGVPKWWDVVVTPVFGEGRKISQLLVVSRDITQRKQTEDALEKSQKLLREAQAYAHIGYWALEADMNTVTWSDETYRIVGLEPDIPVTFETVKQLVHPDDLPRLIASFSAALTEGCEHSIEYRVLFAAGEERWVSCQGAPLLDECGEVVRVTGFLQDITERKRSEQTLEQTLEDKEVLLREIHHRVKNNLQVVASLLSLQAMHAEEAATVDALKESGRRIQLMAQVHEKLYRSSNLARVRIESFIDSLIEDMIASYGFDSRKIELTTDIESITLHIDQAIPCSQIVSELVSNSLKHAFPGSRGGNISVSMSIENGKIVLWVEDDGVGMPEGIDWRQTKTIGLQIINALAKQLESDIEMFVDKGTKFKVSFLRA